MIFSVSNLSARKLRPNKPVQAERPSEVFIVVGV
jgi:hypothetical protein